MRWKVIAILIIAAGLGVYFYLSGQDKFTTVDQQEINFKVDDPDAVTKIFIARKQAEPVILTREKDGWVVNGKAPAKENNIQFLLYETMAKQKVKGPAPKAAHDPVIRKMAVTGIKVQVFTDDPNKPIQEYYVGQSTPELDGNYFWKEGAKDPYLVHIPGRHRILDPAYIFQEKEWISLTIFETPREDIAKIEVDYPDRPESSFEITQDDSTFNITTEKGNPTDVNVSAVRSYLNHFEKLRAEGFTELMSDTLVDSLLQTKPFAILSVTDKGGKKVTMEAFMLPSYDKMHGLRDPEGNLLQYDPNRYMARASNFDRPLIIQDYTFRKVLVGYDQFLLENAQVQ